MGEDLSGRWEWGRMAQNGSWEAASDGDRAACHRYIAASRARSSLVVSVNLCRQLQGAVLQHLGVGHADTHFRRGVLD